MAVLLSIILWLSLQLEIWVRELMRTARNCQQGNRVTNFVLIRCRIESITKVAVNPIGDPSATPHVAVSLSMENLNPLAQYLESPHGRTRE